MTLSNNHSNHSHLDSSEQPPAKESTFANPDPAVSRRDFLGMTATSLILAGGLAGAAKPDSKNGIPHRTLGRSGESVSLIGLGGRASVSFVRESMKESISSTIAGTTTAERVKSAWVKHCAMVIARKPF